MNLEKNHLKWLPIIPFILFSLIIIIRPMLFGFDPYYYYSISCGTVPSGDGFGEIVWKLLDCSIWLFKLLIILCAGIFYTSVYYAGRLLSKEYGAILPLLMGLSPLFFLTLGNAEDDLLGLPFIGLSIYFLIRSIQLKSLNDYLIGIGIILLGGLLWHGIILWLIIYLLANPFTGLLSAGILFFFYDNIFVSNKLVSEDIPIAGVLTNSFVILGILFLPVPLIIPGVFTILLSLFKLKYSFYLTIIGSIGIFNYLLKKDFFWEDKKIVLGLPKIQSMIIIILLFNLVGMISLYSNPSNNTLQFIERSVKIIDKNHLINDWEIGHIISAYGGKPSNAFGPPDPDYNFYHDGYALTRKKLDCKTLDSEGPYFFYKC